MFMIAHGAGMSREHATLTREQHKICISFPAVIYSKKEYCKGVRADA